MCASAAAAADDDDDDDDDESESDDAAALTFKDCLLVFLLAASRQRPRDQPRSPWPQAASTLLIEHHQCIHCSSSSL